MKYVIFCKSAILNRFVPTAWGAFDSYVAAHHFAMDNIKNTEFSVEIVTH